MLQGVTSDLEGGGIMFH